MSGVESSYDVVVIGAGHNGLICANYLQRAGLSVCVFESRLEAGGGLCTEESTVPGFLHNLASVFHDAVEIMPAMRDLDLARYGMEYVKPEVQLGMAPREGRPFLQYDTVEKTCRAIARRNPADAAAWGAMAEGYDEYFRTLVVPALYAPPPKASEQSLALEETVEGRGFLRMMKATPLDVARDAFADEATRAALLFQLLVPRGVVYDSAGLGMMIPLLVTGIELSHLAKGGSHHLAHALWRALLSAKGKLRGTLRVSEIVVEGGRATGVVLETGERVRATKAIVSAIDIEQTFLELIAEKHLPATFRKTVAGHKPDEFSLFGVHLALKEAPRYRGAALEPDLDRAFKVGIGFDTTADFHELFADVRLGRLPERPRLFACCPTLFDHTQAPPEHHTAFCWAVAPYALADGGADAWDRHSASFAKRCLEAWRAVAPNMGGDNILAMRTLSPRDLPRKFKNMREGSVFGGRMTQDQLDAFRPLPELSDFRTPLKGLYLAGASQHPGGGILGACGAIAAEAVTEDLRIHPWWS